MTLWFGGVGAGTPIPGITGNVVVAEATSPEAGFWGMLQA